MYPERKKKVMQEIENVNILISSKSEAEKAAILTAKLTKVKPISITTLRKIN